MQTDISQLIRIAKLHYKEHLSKTEIAIQEKIPRARVAGMLQEAVDAGVINIQITEHTQINEFLQHWIQTYYALKSCTIVPVIANKEEESYNNLVNLIAQNLMSYNEKGVRLGVDGKKAVQQVVTRYLTNSKSNCMDIVPISGNTDINVRMDSQLTQKKEYAHLHMPYPLDVKTEEDRKIYYQSSLMKELVTKWKNIDVALLSIDNAGEYNYYYNSDLECLYLMKELLTKRRQCIGRMIGRSINIYGQVIDDTRNRKVIGIELEQLLPIRHTLAIAYGRSNLFSIIGMLNTGLITDLYLDETTAELLQKVASLKDSRSI